jgi:hypothetical protein
MVCGYTFLFSLFIFWIIHIKVFYNILPEFCMKKVEGETTASKTPTTDQRPDMPLLPSGDAVFLDLPVRVCHLPGMHE